MTDDSSTDILRQYSYQADDCVVESTTAVYRQMGVKWRGSNASLRVDTGTTASFARMFRYELPLAYLDAAQQKIALHIACASTLDDGDIFMTAEPVLSADPRVSFYLSSNAGSGDPFDTLRTTVALSTVPETWIGGTFNTYKLVIDLSLYSVPPDYLPLTLWITRPSLTVYLDLAPEVE